MILTPLPRMYGVLIHEGNHGHHRNIIENCRPRKRSLMFAARRHDARSGLEARLVLHERDARFQLRSLRPALGGIISGE